MGVTIAEKVLNRASGVRLVRAGYEIKTKPGVAITSDPPSITDIPFGHVKTELSIDKLFEAETLRYFHQSNGVTTFAEER
jgi:hypothetical protein